jgi:hypothetical protein
MMVRKRVVYFVGDSHLFQVMDGIKSTGISPSTLETHLYPSPLRVYPDRRKVKVRIVEAARICVDKVCRGEVNIDRIS